MKNSNLPKVFEVIQLFAKHNGNFSWPARKTGNETPFSMLLEKLAKLKKKEEKEGEKKNKKSIPLKIIRFLIDKYSKIDMFQEDKCAEIIQKILKK
jgi:hypothetical protein